MGVVLVVGKFQANRVVVHVDRKVVLTKVGRWSQTDTDFDAVAGHGTEGLDATETKVEEGWEGGGGLFRSRRRKAHSRSCG